MSISGWRRKRIRLRRRITTPSTRASVMVLLLGGVPGEREEDVVERRAADGHVVDPHAGLVERTHRRGDVHPAGDDHERGFAARLLAERVHRLGLVLGVL